ncbi:hypothetical protein AXG93_1550s1010 [Marchantia polymorpha subsp. ruderalis]|uniref:Uncharacterized protein n=3 Tax=Marchantia polymorpha TaxID=3197 RepID=A0A176WSC5_MARPO|nr:hypothetical protein AXG93_1550s1010 [Marchantia polymorpha subsp. ruderalis]
MEGESRVVKLSPKAPAWSVDCFARDSESRVGARGPEGSSRSSRFRFIGADSVTVYVEGDLKLRTGPLPHISRVQKLRCSQGVREGRGRGRNTMASTSMSFRLVFLLAVTLAMTLASHTSFVVAQDLDPAASPPAPAPSPGAAPARLSIPSFAGVTFVGVLTLWLTRSCAW